jgi:iron complex outermembrane recepter protein
MKRIVLLISCCLIYLTTSAQTGKIKGIIKTSDGTPAGQIRVVLKGTIKKTKTNASGVYEFKDIQSGKYTLQTLVAGLESKQIHVEVTENETVIIPEIILTENSSTLNEVIVSSGRNYTKEPSTVINRLEIKSIENPQSIQLISKELLKDKQIQTVGEAVKSMAGVNAFSSSQYSDYVMRGFRAASGNFAYNGIRGDFYQFDEAALTYNIESIESIKGPASVLFSAGNPGGIINHVTKKAHATPRYEIEYTFGSFNQHRVMADATGALSGDEKLLYRMVVGYENTGQLDENLKLRNVFVAPQFQFNFNEKTNLNYELNYANDNRTMGFNRGTPAQFNPTTNDWTLDRFPSTTSLVDPNGQSQRNTVSNQLTFKHSFNERVKFNLLYRNLITKTFQGDLKPGAFDIGSINDSIPLENTYWNEDLYNHQISSYLNIKLTQDKYIKNNLVVGFDFNIGGRTAEFASFEERIVSVLNPEFGWGFYNRAGQNAPHFWQVIFKIR